MEARRSYVCLILAFSSAILTTIAGDTCDFPPPQNIDWEMLSKHSWYQIFGHHQVGIGNTYSCMAMHRIKRAKNGFTAVLEDFVTAKGQYEGIPIRSIRRNTGSYKWKSTHVSQWKELSTESHKNFTPNMSKEVYAAYHSDRSYYTDYKNYLIIFYCSNKGDKYIVVASPNRHPTAKDTLKVINKLVELGHGWNMVKLQVSGCAHVKALAYP